MSDDRFEPRDYFSPEAKAQFEVLKATLAQAKLKYVANLKWHDLPIPEDDRLLIDHPGTAYLQGMRDAVVNLSHTLGSIAGKVINAERKRLRERDEHDNFGL